MASELIEVDLYGGRYHAVHNPNAKGSQPRYVVTPHGLPATKPKGVTTIMGKVLAKDFVGWALDCMEGYLEERLPVITAEDLKEAKLESSRRRDAGAGTGSETHALVEHFLKGQAEPASASTEAMKAYTAFTTWFNRTKPVVIGVEQVIYSEDFDYAGTYDCMLEIDGKVYLCDLKTTNASRQAPKGVYAEYFIQLGAYALAHEEQRRKEIAETGASVLPAIEGLMVISAKKNGKLDVITEEDLGLKLQDCIEMFKRVVNLYRFLQHTTKALGGR